MKSLMACSLSLPKAKLSKISLVVTTATRSPWARRSSTSGCECRDEGVVSDDQEVGGLGAAALMSLAYRPLRPRAGACSAPRADAR